MSAEGVAEVASIGGYIKEYQVDIDPHAMKAHGVTIAQIIKAIKESNLDIGARTIEFNRAEYLVRSLGYLKSLEDLEQSVVRVKDNIPVRLRDVAHVGHGPGTRRGGLDKGGAEAVGGVVVARYGANPMEVIQNVKAKIKELSPGLPSKKLDNGLSSKVEVVPFYDRTGLIKETLGTLESALSHEILISIIVVMVLVLNLKASILISGLLPIGVLMTFIVMRYFGVDANIVALSGIAIAIGVMVDVGVIFTENIVRHLEMPKNKGARGKQLRELVFNATSEVGPAVITALTTTVISFLPVFAMQAAEGKLFKPLAFTKTFAMISALIIGLIFIPAMAQGVFSLRTDKQKVKRILSILLLASGGGFILFTGNYLAMVLLLMGANLLLENQWPEKYKYLVNIINIGLALLFVLFLLSREWLPLGATNSLFSNFLFVMVIIGAVLGVLFTIVKYYKPILSWCLAHKRAFLILPIATVLFGILIWQGASKTLGFIPAFFDRMGYSITSSKAWIALDETFPGVGKEFMPTLDEGSFLLMPTTMPHSGVEENLEIIRLLDQRVNSIPEVDQVVGKWGRVNSALDPAPISMFENIINYKPEYILDEDGHRIRFRVNRKGAFVLRNGQTYHPGKDSFRLISAKKLIPDKKGEYFRQWRDFINSPEDIWSSIVEKANIPGLTSAPKLQPIQTRLVMLQTGMRAPMGIKVFGPDLETIEETGLKLEQHLKNVPGIKPSSVFADRVVGKPYLEINLDRQALGRYGITVKEIQQYLASMVGGKVLTTTVEGRERFPVRARYARSFRDGPEDLNNMYIPTAPGAQVPLGEVAEIQYTKGPQMIKSENTFLVSYVIFDKKDGFAEVDVVESAQNYLNGQIQKENLVIPAGVNYVFTGNYENQVRATKRLLLVIPISLVVIFLILYFQFRSATTSAMIFSGIFVAFAGGFLMIWLYGQGWFMNFSVAGINMRDLFQMGTINLSVAVWVGFIALFGIATDDGVIMGTYLQQVFQKNKPNDRASVRASVLDAGSKRVRPAMMTAATAIIALIPVLTSTGKGSDIMVPMAIPAFGGMLIQVMTMFVVPVLYSMWHEKKVAKSKEKPFH